MQRNGSLASWGGRYVLSTPAGEARAIWTNSPDTFAYEPGQTDTSNQATIPTATRSSSLLPLP